MGDPESVNLCDVVRSSAGFQGWVEADLSTMILTLSVLSETVEDVKMVRCTNMGGEVVAAIPLAVEQSLEQFQDDLSEVLRMRPDQLQLVLPDARVLELAVYGAVPLLDLLLEQMTIR